MRLTFGVLTLVLILYALPAAACERCADYFEWQNSTWCSFCEASSCGYMECHLEDWGYPGYDAVCMTSGENCFENEYCPEYKRFMGSLAIPKLEQTWQLASVRVYDSRAQKIKRVPNKG